MISVPGIEIVQSNVKSFPPPSLLDDKKFIRLLRSVQAALRGSEQRGVAWEATAVAAAICVLTGQRRVSPADLQPHIVVLCGLLARCMGKKRRARLAVDCAIAYGVGWRRNVMPDTEDRNVTETWETAVDLLDRLVSGAIKNANYYLWSLLKSVLGQERAKEVSTSLEENTRSTTMRLRTRLMKPVFVPRGNLLPFTVRAEELYTRIEALLAAERLQPLPPGGRYVFGVEGNWVRSRAGDREVTASAGDRIVVRGMDFGAAAIRFPIAANDGPAFQLELRDKAVVENVPHSDAYISCWECGCGTWDCDNRHRLSAWVPGLITLEEFVNSAINGRNYPLVTKSFINGMYYAYLSRDCFDYVGDKPNSPPHIRFVHLVAFDGTELNSQFILVDPKNPPFEVARVLRCPAEKCRRWTNVTGRERGEGKCDYCPQTMPEEEPTTAWKSIDSAPPPVPLPPPGSKDEPRVEPEHDSYTFWREWLDKRMKRIRELYKKLRRRIQDEEAARRKDHLPSQVIPGTKATLKRYEMTDEFLKLMCQLLKMSDRESFDRKFDLGVKWKLWSEDGMLPDD